MPANKKIGFIGLGAMGRGLAGNLTRAGYDVVVWDRMPAAAEAFASKTGARIAAGPAELGAEVDIAISMVPDAPDVRSITLDAGGLIESGNKNLIYIDMSTIDPTTSRAVGAALAEVGIRMIDSPVGRGVAEAEAGTVTFMVGGDADLLSEVRPVLKVMSSEILHVGSLGAGSAIKLVNNFLGGGIIATIAEALALGVKSGLTVEQIIDLSDRTGTSNKILNTVLPAKAFLADYTPGFASRLAAKDQRLALKLGKDLGVDLPVGEVVMARYAACEEAFPAEDYMGSLMRLVEKQADTKLRLKGN
ncbi:NAD(P)-dependent oxidoreductase [Mesorhizobium sp. Z1-4]|uniref:NAD(P)-dependent oxidoreductase n=1 Tax=Mesorhizobium sp. Z1-4 TaxID=2448478 RepID=UPI000FD6FA67|nr:NAD(P)-dependent oxidoreductase [Mesorhizobium sp. Z1-4]